MAEEAKEAEKKYFVDEDWKSQVAAEKRSPCAKQEQAAPQPAAAAADEELPEPSLSLLANSLYLRRLSPWACCPIPSRERPKRISPRPSTPSTRWKSSSRRPTKIAPPEETTYIEEMLHQLRLAYLAVRTRRQAGMSNPAAVFLGCSGATGYASAGATGYASAGATGHASTGATGYASAGATGYASAGATGHASTGATSYASAGATGYASALGDQSHRGTGKASGTLT